MYVEAKLRGQNQLEPSRPYDKLSVPVVLTVLESHIESLLLNMYVSLHADRLKVGGRWNSCPAVD
jgi:hypothetical protein